MFIEPVESSKPSANEEKVKAESEVFKYLREKEESSHVNEFKAKKENIAFHGFTPRNNNKKLPWCNDESPETKTAQSSLELQSRTSRLKMQQLIYLPL